MTNRRRLFGTGLLIGTLSLPLGTAHALKQDRDQPVKINAASVDMNQKTGVTVYRGKVVLIQGSLRIEADRIDVQTRSLHVETITATGRPVRLRALLDNREDELKASAEQLVLSADARTIDMTGDVHVYQGGDQFSAQRLHYALDEKRVSANGSGDENDRVYAILQPTPKPASPKTTP